MSREFLDFLKRGRDIRIKPKFSGGKTGFRCTPDSNIIFPISIFGDQENTNSSLQSIPLYTIW